MIDKIPCSALHLIMALWLISLFLLKTGVGVSIFVESKANALFRREHIEAETRRNGRHFADGIFILIFSYGNVFAMHWSYVFLALAHRFVLMVA